MNANMSNDNEPDSGAYPFSMHALGIDLDSQLERAADFLLALAACW